MAQKARFIFTRVNVPIFNQRRNKDNHHKRHTTTHLNTGLDGKNLYTSKEWTERLRHYIKRIYDIDIKPGFIHGKQNQQAPDGQRKNQKQDKISFGEPDHQEPKSSPKEILTQMPTPLTRKD